MKNIQYFGHLGKVDDPFEFYQEQDYIICRGATDLQQIDELVDFYEKFIVTSPYKFLRQSAQWESNKKSPVGGILNTFLDPHCYEEGVNGEWADHIFQVLSSRQIQEVLAKISEQKTNFRVFQTMLFDHTTTKPHQDWIFLDSKPNGHLIAGWVALEDIYPESIRFYVYPGTHKFYPRAKYDEMLINQPHSIHESFLKEIEEVLEETTSEMYAPPLQKGDIFFWGSRIIHGSTEGTNPQLRRRSLAAHFVPEGFGFGNLTEEVHYNFKNKYGLSYCEKELDQWFVEYNNLAEISEIQEVYNRSDSHSIEKQLQELNDRYQSSQIRIHELETEINAMKTSKFWQMREQWFKFKETLGIKNN